MTSLCPAFTRAFARLSTVSRATSLQSVFFRSSPIFFAASSPAFSRSSIALYKPSCISCKISGSSLRRSGSPFHKPSKIAPASLTPAFTISSVFSAMVCPIFVIHSMTFGSSSGIVSASVFIRVTASPTAVSAITGKAFNMPSASFVMISGARSPA